MPIDANYPALFRRRECETQFCQIIRKCGRVLINNPRNVWKLVNFSLQIEIVFERERDFFHFTRFFCASCSYHFNGDCLVNVVVNSCGFQFCLKSWQFWLTSVSLATAFLIPCLVREGGHKTFNAFNLIGRRAWCYHATTFWPVCFSKFEFSCFWWNWQLTVPHFQVFSEKITLLQ